VTINALDVDCPNGHASKGVYCSGWAKYPGQEHLDVGFAVCPDRIRAAEDAARSSLRTVRDRDGTRRIATSKGVRVKCPSCGRDVAGQPTRVLEGWFKAGFHHGPTTFDTERCPGVGAPVRST
jgi:hypothetical protein